MTTMELERESASFLPERETLLFVWNKQIAVAVNINGGALLNVQEAEATNVFIIGGF